MQIRRLVIGCLLLSMATAVQIHAEPVPPPPALRMSPDLRQLFQAEMRELLAGAQAIAGALPTGSWDGIASSAMSMRDSYVLEKKLTRTQEAEIARLPDAFKAMDADFHDRAEKLAVAARARDAEAASFQFSRLLETCAGCHAAFARDRFPGFQAAQEEARRQ